MVEIHIRRSPKLRPKRQNDQDGTRCLIGTYRLRAQKLVIRRPLQLEFDILQRIERRVRHLRLARKGPPIARRDCRHRRAPGFQRIGVGMMRPSWTDLTRSRFRIFPLVVKGISSKAKKYSGMS